MPSEHAVLSPSSAERWLQCPASIQLVETLDLEVQSESPYALEGTIAHELAELKASVRFDKITTEQFRHRRVFWHKRYADVLDQDDVEVEMERHTDAYVDLIVERQQLYPYSQVMFEQRLDSGVPSSWGTSDTVIVSPEHVEIIDFKYGQGITVQAKGNPQLRLYGLGALETFGDLLGETEVVHLTVHQPRLDHTLTDTLTPAELRAWREEITPVAEEALAPGAHFGPSETACHFCPASGRCRAQLEAVFAEPFELSPVLTPEDVSETLPRLPQIREWLKAFEEAALHMAYSAGIDIPGYKVVLSGGRRTIPDQEAAIAALLERGYATEEVAKVSLRGIGELEKLMGKEKFAELCAPYIKPPEGKPAIVPESDNRPSISPSSEAMKEFRE